MYWKIAYKTKINKRFKWAYKIKKFRIMSFSIRNQYNKMSVMLNMIVVFNKTKVKI